MEKIIHKFTGKATIGGIEYLAKVIRIYFSELDGSESIEGIVAIIDNVINDEVNNKSFIGGMDMNVDEFITTSFGRKIQIISPSNLREAKIKGKSSCFSQQIRFSDGEEHLSYLEILSKTSGYLRETLKKAIESPDLLATISYTSDIYTIAMLPFNAREGTQIHSQDYYTSRILNKYPICAHIRYNELIEINTDIILLKENG